LLRFYLDLPILTLNLSLVQSKLLLYTSP